jgi:hypothetical protein
MEQALARAVAESEEKAAYLVEQITMERRLRVHEIKRAVEAAVKADQEAWGRDHPGCLPVARKNAALTARLADAELVLDRIANDYGTDNALDDAMYYQQLAAGALKENT